MATSHLGRISGFRFQAREVRRPRRGGNDVEHYYDNYDRIGGIAFEVRYYPRGAVTALDVERAFTFKTVLVVEDEPVIRWMIADALREAGFTVVEAGTADEALVFIRANLVDFVFTDVRMPGAMDGVQLAHTLKRDFPLLPVVVTSGHLTRPELDLDIPLVSKPYGLGEVVALVAAAIGGKVEPDDTQ